MQKSPSYQWYSKDAISSARIAVMTLEEEGAYRRALDFCWLTGSLPADTDLLVRIIGKGCTPQTAEVVKGMFTRSKTHRNQLIHDRLDAERTKQEAWREKSIRGGLKSAALRRESDSAGTATAIAAAAPAVKKTAVIRSPKKTSELLVSLHTTQVDEMMAGKFSELKKMQVMRKLDEEFPTGYEFRDERHVFNAFKNTAAMMLKAITKTEAKKPFDPMSRMRKLN